MAQLAQKFVIGRKDIFVDLFGNVIDTEEPGRHRAALMSQGKSLVYYATMVNDVCLFLTGNKKNAFSPAFTTFPMTQDLTKIQTFAATKSVTLPDGITLAIEVKSAGLRLHAAQRERLHHDERDGAQRSTSNPAQWVPSGTKNVTWRS